MRDSTTKAIPTLATLRLVGVTVTHLLVACGSSPDRGAAVDPSVVQQVRAVFGLEYPYTITRIGMYLDGGSIGVSVRDATGSTLAFAWDGRMRLSADSKAPEAPRLLYIGAQYPGVEGTRAVAVGSAEEDAVIALLRAYADTHMTRSQQDSLVALYYDYTHERPPDLPAFTKIPTDRSNTIQAVHLVQILERQRSRLRQVKTGQQAGIDSSRLRLEPGGRRDRWEAEHYEWRPVR